MSNQCKSCGGFCAKSGCERVNAALDDNITAIEETRACEEEWTVIVAMCRAIEAAVIANLAQGVDMPEAVNNDLADDISAIDAMYRGGPTYEHDAYYMRKAAEKCVRKGYALYTADQLRTCIAAARVKAYAAAGAAPVEPSQAPQGCACRWDAEDNRIATCTRHQGWLDVVQEWADRAKDAEAKLAQPPVSGEAAREYMTGYSDAKELAKPSQALDLSDDEIDALLPTITLKGLDPKQQVWLTKKDAIAFARAIIAAINAKEQLNG